MATKIKPRERKAIIQSLQAGVVPSIGLHHIQVGRKDEVAAVLKDLEYLAQGGAAIRFVIGRFGSGKTFFLNLMRILAMEKKFVVLQADITTERRLYATGGQARALYAELMRNMSTKAKPMGGALPSVVERWISNVDHQVRTNGGKEEDVQKEIYRQLQPLQDYVSGYDFAAVISQYLQGYQSADDHLQQAAIRWLRAEYTTKTEARRDLDVRNIIDDAQFYDYIKLMAAFVRLAGYKGLLVNIDEMVVLSHRLNSSKARNSNYEAILRILNDCLQGNVSCLGFLFGGTDEFLEDNRRGLFSYEALKRRLAANTFAADGLKDFSGPVISLENLTPEDLYVLLMNIRHVFSNGNPENYIIPDDALDKFLLYCNKHLGAEYFKTPGDSVKKFVNFLNVLEQNPEKNWRSILNVENTASPKTKKERSPDDEKDDSDLVRFKL
jgi:hypothetical protein